MRTLFALAILTALALPARSADRILLVAGGQKDGVDIAALDAVLMEPFGTAFDPLGQLWIIEMASGNRLLKIDSNGTLLHVAGQKKSGFSGDGGPIRNAQFNGPHNLAIRPDGRILIGDTWNGRVRQIDLKSGLVDSIQGFDVPVDKAKGAGPYCITLDFTGKYLYVADLKYIHRIELATGKSVKVAGNGEKGIPKDGAVATMAPLSDPRAVAVDRLGNTYILERGGNALRVVNAEGVIRTVVNTTGKKGSARLASNKDDGELDISEPAITAMMNGPKHLCVDLQNRVVIADAENHLIRRYDPTDGTLTRIAGTGKSGSKGVGGDPLLCQLARPHGVTVHPTSGELYITDSYNNRVLHITAVDK